MIFLGSFNKAGAEVRVGDLAEFDDPLLRLGGARGTDSTDAKHDLWRDFAEPALMNAGPVDQRLADVRTTELDAPPSSPDAQGCVAGLLR